MPRSVVGALLMFACVAVVIPCTWSASAATDTFTIRRIEPDASSNLVLITFSGPVNMELLRKNLRIFPYAPLYWYGSRQLSQRKILLKGRFRYGQRYVISFPERFTMKGAVYRKTLNHFIMPDRSPATVFAEPGTVIERDSRQMLHLRVVNCPRIMVRTVNIPPLLLPVALAAINQKTTFKWPSFISELKGERDAARQALKGSKASSLPLGGIFQKSAIFYTSGEKNEEMPFSIPLSFRPHPEKGSIQLIEASSAEPAGASKSALDLFRITDIGLTAKLSPSSLLVWATSLRRGDPLAAVDLLAIDTDGNIFRLGKTGSDGVLLISGSPRDGHGPFQVKASALRWMDHFQATDQDLNIASIRTIVAVTPKDAGYIEIGPGHALAMDDITTDFSPRNNQRLLKAALFTDRGVYRPGSDVHFKAVVRRFQDGRVVAAKGRFVVRMSDARSQTIYNRTLTLSAFGSAWDSVHLPTYGAVGAYHLQIERTIKGKKPVVLAAHSFQVQEFRPPRHKVRIQCRRESRLTTEYVNIKRRRPLVRIEIDGIYYAGGPVQHGRARWRIFHSPCRYEVPGHNDYSFGYQSGDEPKLLETGEAALDEKGRLVVRFPLDHDVVTGKRSLLISATVIDFDGRTATETTTFQVKPKYLIGISRHPEQIEAETSRNFRILVIDEMGERIREGVLTAAVLRKSGAYVRTRNAQGNLVWRYEDLWRRLYATPVPIKDGQAVFEIRPEQGGDYLLSFTYRDDRGESYTSATLIEVVGDRYWVAYEERERSFQRLAMAADRKSYRPGDTAYITVSPRQPLRWALLTQEQDSVLSYSVLSAEELLSPISIPMTEKSLPNVYVSLLAVNGRSRFPLYSKQYDSGAPAFQWAVLNLAVERDAIGLKVEVTPESGRLRAEPGSEMTLDIEAKDDRGRPVPCEMAVGVINEAVLALTHFKTPELGKLRRFDAPSGVLTNDLRAILLHQTPFHSVRSEALTGGGEEEAEAPLADVRRTFNPVAFFDPAVVTDSSGRAQVRFTLPDTMTTYRIYVVAVDRGARFADTDRSLVVTKSFYLEPGLPRFFHVGDRFRFPLLLFNRGEQGGTAKVHWRADPRLRFHPGSAELALTAAASGRIMVGGTAVSAGEAQLLFQGAFNGHRDKVAVTIPVEPSWILGDTVGQGSFVGEVELRAPLSREALDIDWSKVGFNNLEATLELSASPLLLLAGPLHYLLQYPYGCVEQTSSAVIALAGLRSLIATASLPGFTVESIDPFLKKGVSRLLGMQTESGGFGYWPGYVQPHRWGTLYAAAALSLAAQNRCEVDEKALARAADYILRQAGNKHASNLYRAFSSYVLTLMGRGNSRMISSLLSETARLQRLERILTLLAAEQNNMIAPEPLAGKVRRCLLSGEATAEYPIFNGKYLEPAFALLLAARVLPDDTFTLKTQRQLLERLEKRDHWTSTGDTGWVLLALGQRLKHLRGRQESQMFSVRYGSDQLVSKAVPPAGLWRIALKPEPLLKAPLLRVCASGDSPVYYQVTVRYPRLDVERQGADHGLRVTKKVRSLDGDGRIRLGDIVRVTVDVELEHGPQHYLILDDPLPAGLVAVNSALAAEEPVGSVSLDAYQAQYMTPDGYYRLRPNYLEIRDRKVIAFRDLMWRGAYRFEYYARAVCEGSFTIPPTKAEVMYDPRVNGYSGAQVLTIDAQQ